MRSSIIIILIVLPYRVSQKFAIFRRTQNLFSEYVQGVRMCLFVDFLFSIVKDFDSKMKKLIKHVLSKIMERKTVDSYCFIIVSKSWDFQIVIVSCSEYHQQ